MKFLQELILLIFYPRKRNPVRYQLTPAQQRKVMQGCSELNSLIQEVHDNLSDIRNAGSATIHLTKQTHKNNIEGRKSLQQQQQEYERINNELKQISETMRAVRENVARSSQKTIASYNGLKTLQSKVMNLSATESIEEEESKSAEVVQFPVARTKLDTPSRQL
ncbi:MAG: hypothetical protein MI867_11865 [Pseudomonadales bacterium]|nr:hypothetical protein [Pseudomonadales bacterium]